MNAGCYTTPTSRWLNTIDFVLFTTHFTEEVFLVATEGSGFLLSCGSAILEFFDSIHIDGKDRFFYCYFKPLAF